VAARLTHGAAAVVAATVVAFSAAGCGSAAGTPAVAASPANAFPTPVTSLTPSMSGTLAAISSAAAGAGFTLRAPSEVYRPSEPESLSTVPRAVYQVALADPSSGFVVIYELDDAQSAAGRGRELADYLGSNFGQTNYPHDTQFSVAQLGPTVIFTWWSKDRSRGAPDAERAFRAISAVGQPIPVVK
jgi:hypothetical protein